MNSCLLNCLETPESAEQVRMAFILKVFAIDMKFSNTGIHARTGGHGFPSAHLLYAGIHKHSVPLMGLARVLILG